MYDLLSVEVEDSSRRLKRPRKNLIISAHAPSDTRAPQMGRGTRTLDAALLETRGRVCPARCRARGTCSGAHTSINAVQFCTLSRPDSGVLCHQLYAITVVVDNNSHCVRTHGTLAGAPQDDRTQLPLRTQWNHACVVADTSHQIGFLHADTSDARARMRPHARQSAFKISSRECAECNCLIATLLPLRRKKKSFDAAHADLTDNLTSASRAEQCQKTPSR